MNSTELILLHYIGYEITQNLKILLIYHTQHARNQHKYLVTSFLMMSEIKHYPRIYPFFILNLEDNCFNHQVTYFRLHNNGSEHLIICPIWPHLITIVNKWSHEHICSFFNNINYTFTDIPALLKSQYQSNYLWQMKI